MIFQFKKDLPNVNERKLECNKIRTQCPDKIPIILEKDPKCDIKTLEKTKFLVPLAFKTSQFILMIRQKFKIPETQAFYLLVDGKHSLTGEGLMAEIYDKFKDKEDGFVYISYSSELTWG
jgi:GABA(A) receptor-associated protein